MADSKNTIRLTSEDVEERKKQQTHLRFVEREEVLRQLTEAKSHGDLSENSEYDDAKSRLNEIDAKLAEIEYELNNYELVESNDNIYDIRITNLFDGSSRIIENLTIGGSVNFDLDSNNIPLDSPIAINLKNKKEGSTVNYRVGDVSFKLEVLKITPIKK